MARRTALWRCRRRPLLRWRPPLRRGAAPLTGCWRQRRCHYLELRYPTLAPSGKRPTTSTRLSSRTLGNPVAVGRGPWDYRRTNWIGGRACQGWETDRWQGGRLGAGRRQPSLVIHATTGAIKGHAISIKDGGSYGMYRAAATSLRCPPSLTVRVRGRGKGGCGLGRRHGPVLSVGIRGPEVGTGRACSHAAVRRPGPGGSRRAAP